MAAELSLLYLQRAEGGGGSGTGSVVGGSSNIAGSIGGTIGGSSGAMSGFRGLGPVLETALQRAPILHMQSGNLQRAVERFL